MSKILDVTVALEPVSNTVGVVSPFNEEFISRARSLGGKWVNKRWEFPGRMEAAVRALCMEMYGTDNGTPRASREALEARLASLLTALQEVQEQLAQLDGAAGEDA
jgi:hypothetical protein